MKSCIIYETIEEQGQSDFSPEALKNMSKEDRINLIRFGPDKSGNKPKKIAVDLLQKYKPILNLNKYKMIAEDLEKEAIKNSKNIKIEK